MAQYIARMCVELWVMVDAQTEKEALDKTSVISMDEWEGASSDIDVEVTQ